MTSPAPDPPPPKKRPPRKGPSPARTRKKTRRPPPKPPIRLRQEFLLLTLEVSGLAVAGITAVIVLLGYGGNVFAGTSLFANLLPFAGSILGLILCTALLLTAWLKMRPWLRSRSIILPAAIALAMALLIGGFLGQNQFSRAFGYYRTLVGGKAEAGRVTLAHQVYAAYRRLPGASLASLIDRAEPYLPALTEAAAAYDLDLHLLQGLAATESSFIARDSKDGGHGLFQITSIPAKVTQAVDKLFPAEARRLTNPRYNAFLGAATLRHYLSEMKDDLFLGLLAYNIGPANGGLRFIMAQYGATDFVTIQPYLLQLPRDYPIRVLTHALAFRIRAREGRLLAYEEGQNALRIQGLGIPGLDQKMMGGATR